MKARATAYDFKPLDPEEKFDEAHWDKNPSRAISKAKALNRPLLIMFSALEWNETSHALINEVFQTKEFNDFANEHLILTYLDYPQSKLDTPDILRSMRDHYNIRGFPSVLLLNSRGKEVHRIRGFVSGQKENYLKELKLATLDYRGLDWTELETAEDSNSAGDQP